MGYAVPKMVNVSVQAEHFRYAAFLANLKSNLSSAFVTHVSRARAEPQPEAEAGRKGG